jgi:hypothetical protein
LSTKTIPPLDLEPNADSSILMERIDALPPQYRRLVYEYGYKIVTALLDDCEGEWPAPDDLEFDLMMWRERRQNEWLASDVWGMR